MIKARINGLELEFDNVDDLIEYQSKLKRAKENSEDKFIPRKRPEPVVEKVIVVTKPKEDGDSRYSPKNPKTSNYHNSKFPEVKRLIDSGMALHKAIRKVFNLRSGGGTTYYRYKNWLAEGMPKGDSKKVLSKRQHTIQNFEQVRELNKKGISISSGFDKVIGYRDGKTIKAYRKWLKRKYGELPHRFKAKRKKLQYSEVSPTGEQEPKKTEKTQKTGQNVAQAKPDKRTLYMARKHGIFLHFRNKHVKNVMKNMNLSYKQALKYLGSIYKQYKSDEDRENAIGNKANGIVKINRTKFISEFPEIAYIDNDNLSLLVSMLENLIKYPSAELRRDIEGELLGIKVQWDAFIESFVVKSGKIADFFGVPNRFALKDKVIRYNR